MLATFLCALAVAPAAWTSTSYQEIDSVASWLAQREVNVRCLTEKESNSDVPILLGADAYVKGDYDSQGNWHPSSYTVFRNGICEPLLELQDGYIRDWNETAFSIMVLVHESGHLRGHRWSTDEAKTQCWAMRHFRYTAQRFGVEDTLSLNILYAEALEIHLGMPEEYQLKSCKLPSP